MIKKYRKLIRDNIPAIIKKDGKTCQVVVLDDKEYLVALTDKLGEELKEYQADFSMEELADMQEVINAIVKANGLSKEQFDALREKKRLTNGGFDKKLMLLEVDDQKNKPQLMRFIFSLAASWFRCRLTAQF
jgi:predicted house-cleaning noncanonical NTP pyrophosphatase (MazG superfamily)